MLFQVRPIPFKPSRLNGLSARLIASHYENNYGGAVRRLNAIRGELGALDAASIPGFRLNGLKPEVVTVGKDCQIDDLLTHDETAEEPTLAYLLSRFAHDTSKDAVNPYPEPVGVYRSIRKPTYEELLDGRINDAVAKKGKGKVEDLFKAEDVWTVE